MGCPRMAPWPLLLAQRRPPSPPLSPLLLMPPNHLGFLLAEGRASAQCPGCNPAGALTAPATQPHPPLARLTEGLARPEASEEVQHQGLEPGFLRSCVCVLRGGGEKEGGEGSVGNQATQPVSMEDVPLSPLLACLCGAHWSHTANLEAVLCDQATV